MVLHNYKSEDKGKSKDKVHLKPDHDGREGSRDIAQLFL
jgi:hypothetical protein